MKPSKNTLGKMHWNVRAFSPHIIAPETQRFLNQQVIVEGAEKQSFKLYEVIMSRVLLGPFDDTQFPFGAVLLGCAQTGYREELEKFMGTILSGINRDQGEKMVSAEGIAFELQNGSFHILVAMPVRDIPEDDRSSYLKASLLPNFEKMKPVWEWCQELFAQYIVPANKVFVLTCVMAQARKILDRKVSQIEEAISSR